MLFLLTNRTRSNLSRAEYGELAALAKAFYASIPPSVKLLGEWAAVDQTQNYTLMEAPEQLDEVAGRLAPAADLDATLVLRGVRQIRTFMVLKQVLSSTQLPI